MSLPTATKEPLFLTGVMMVFLTYSVTGVVLPSLTTKYVAKSIMVNINALRAENELF